MIYAASQVVIIFPHIRHKKHLLNINKHSKNIHGGMVGHEIR